MLINEFENPSTAEFNALQDILKKAGNTVNNVRKNIFKPKVPKPQRPAQTGSSLVKRPASAIVKRNPNTTSSIRPYSSNSNNSTKQPMSLKKKLAIGAAGVGAVGLGGAALNNRDKKKKPTLRERLGF